jgi:hypothetical protein
MNEASNMQPPNQKQVARDRRIVLLVRSVRLLCLAVAIWIGYDNHWAGFAWIPVGVLLILAIVGNIASWICAFLIHLKVVYNMYQLSNELSRMSPATREQFLSGMDPDFREHFLKWLNKP